MYSAQLFITLGLHALSGLIIFGVAIFVLLQNPKKLLNRLFALFILPIFIYEASFVIAPLMPTEELAYAVWFVNIVDVFIAAANTHFMLAAAGLEKRFRAYIRSAWVAAFGIFVSALVYPSLFLPQVLPKLYFPWYLDGGPLYVVMFAFFFIAPLFPYMKLVQASSDPTRKTRLEYFIFMYAIGFAIGSLNFGLVFNYSIDPLYGSPLGLAMIPIAYGVVADRLFDIRFVLKRALIYSLIIGVVSGAIALLIFLNDLLVSTIPWVQFWTVPTFTASIALIIGRSIWLMLVENERIKYEFMTVATHKLRTPLTQISWGVRELIEKTEDREVRAMAERIQHSTNRLIELTNIIFETTQEDAFDAAYSKEHLGLIGTTRDVLEHMQPTINAKHIKASIHSDEEVYVMADPRRIRSVIEVMLENAVNYTPEGGFVQIIAYEKGGRAIYSIRDSGIGVSPEERRHIFSRFYRTDAAKRADTEGVGLGLAMAKSIIEKHQGKIGVESKGLDKGATFWFSMPKA
ncbi:MAG: ATP-binding protein [Candidatus Paceibacteria bacterium]